MERRKIKDAQIAWGMLFGKLASLDFAANNTNHSWILIELERKKEPNPYEKLTFGRKKLRFMIPWYFHPLLQENYVLDSE